MDFNFDLNELHFDNVGSWPPVVKVIFVGLVVIVLLFAGYWFDTKDQRLVLKGAQHTEVELRHSFESKQHQTANLELYKQQLVDIRSSFSAMLRQLPSKTEVPELLEDISKNGVASGLEFKLFDPLHEVQHDFYAELQIKMTVVGGYDQFGDFISRVASLGRIVTLHDFKVLGNIAADQAAGVKPEQGASQLMMDITAKTYRYVDEIESAEEPAA